MDSGYIMEDLRPRKRGGCYIQRSEEMLNILAENTGFLLSYQKS